MTIFDASPDPLDPAYPPKTNTPQRPQRMTGPGKSRNVVGLVVLIAIVLTMILLIAQARHDAPMEPSAPSIEQTR